MIDFDLVKNLIACTQYVLIYSFRLRKLKLIEKKYTILQTKLSILQSCQHHELLYINNLYLYYKAINKLISDVTT